MILGKKSALKVLLGSRRRGLTGWRMLVLLGVFCTLVVTIVACHLCPSHLSVVIVWTLAAVLLAAWSMATAADSCILEKMKRGSFLSDLRLTRVSPRDVTDGLMLHSVTTVFNVGIWFYLLLVAFAGLAPESSSLSGTDRIEGLHVALWWLPVLIAATCMVSYMSQMTVLARTSKAGGVFSLHYVILCLMACLVSVPLSFVIAIVPAFTMETVIGCLLMMGLVSRSMVLFRLRTELEMPAAEQSFWKFLKPAEPNRSLVLPTDNAIARREIARAASRLPWGLFGLLVWQYGASVTLVLIIYGMGSLAEWQPDFSLFLAIIYLCFFQIARTFNSSVRSIWRERQEGTLELVQQTSLSVKEFVQGWMQALCRPKMLETLAVGICLVAMASPYAGEGALYSVGALAVGLFHMELVGYLGLGISTRLKQRMHTAWYLLIAIGMFYPMLLVVPPMMLCPANNFNGSILIGWALIVFSLTWFATRAFALSGLKQTVHRAGFAS